VSPRSTASIRSAAAIAAITLLAGIVAAPQALAQPVATPDPVPLVDVPDAPGASTDAVDPAHRIETARSTRPVAPGVTLSSFDWYEPGDVGGWVRGDALTVDLAAGTTVDYLYPGQVAKAEPLSTQAGRQRAVAAVNGDFFDINNSDAPLGVGIQRGELIKSPEAGRRRAVGVDAQGIGRVMEIFFDGTVTLPGGGHVPLTQLNAAHVEPGGLGLFNPLWGGYTRAGSAPGANRVTEVVVRGDVVTEVRPAPGADPIPGDGYVLVGREAVADTLGALKPGDRISVAYSTRGPDAVAAAIGGNQLLISDGRIVAPEDPLHPRTAVGFSADGRTMFLLTVDGRQAYQLGLNLRDLAAVLLEMGAHNALNLDGGGSSTLVAREPGQQDTRVENTPSDGVERPVPNGLALYAPAGSGTLTGFWVRPAADAPDTPGAGTVPGGRPDRVFPGLTRRLAAHGHDETYGPVPDAPHRWRVQPAGAGWVDQADVFHAARTGTATVTAQHRQVSGETGLTVLGPLTRISPTSTRVSLPSAGVAGEVGIVGYDDNGFTAPIEPADLRLDYDRELIEVTPDEDGTLRLTGKRDGSTVLTARAGNSVTTLAVTVGLAERVIAGFDDGAQWTFGAARATGSVEPVPDGHTGPGLRLSYDFTQSTGTRTAYAIPPAPIEIQGQPLALGAWVYGNGGGEWTAFTVTDAHGQTRSLYGPYLTWTGWRYLEVPVPSGIAFPLRVNRFYTIETRADRQYTGEVLIDDLIAKVPPDVPLPALPAIPDPVVVQDGTVAERAWRFAVMSDAQFVARDPDSDLVRAARRTLREIRAQHPDFVVINGDLVDEAAPEDLALARRVLTEELGDEVRWYYVPGNHEIMGPGTIENFRREFGVTNRAFDHRGTRFVLLDSSTGTIRGGGFDQAVLLRDALAGARADQSVHSVVVLEHHPSRDPSPAQNSQLSDRREAALVEQWLAEFRRETGKGAAFVGAHAGLFHASRVDGVPYVINGNSGKAPAGEVTAGGFTGWTLFGVDPVSDADRERRRTWPPRPGPEWLAAEIRPHVDALDLHASQVVPPGTAGRVTATVTQGSRRVPVGYPVSFDWSGSLNLHIGDRAGLRPWHVAWLDPDTGALTGVRAGAVTVAITVNGVTARATIRIGMPAGARHAA
jgi:exopolysaccharide biosynthesis protein/3',5'-cyclic AMP phosphodiesterase CpdA